VIKVIEEEGEEGSLKNNPKKLQKNRIMTLKQNQFDTTNKTEIELSHLLMNNKEREMIVSPTELRPGGFDIFRQPTDANMDQKNKIYDFFNKGNKRMELLTGVNAHLDSVASIEFIDNNSLFSFGNDGLIKKWQIQSKDEKTQIKSHSTFRFHSSEIFSSAKGKDLIFSGDRAGQISVLKKDKGKWEFERAFKSGREPVWALDYDRNNNLLLSSSPNKLKIWSPVQLSDTKEQHNFSTNKKFFAKSLFLNNSGDYLVYSFTPDWSKNEFLLRNLETQKEIGTISHSTNFSNDFVIDNSHKILITANEDKTVALYDLRTNKLINSFVAHDSPITSVLSLNGGSQLLTGGADASLRLWDLSTFHCLQELSLHRKKYGGSIFDIARGEGNLIATAGADAMVRFFKLN
jgi:WD40 repeat protein